MNHWNNPRHDVRRVSERAVLDKLRECADAGIDIDRIPLSITLSELIRMPIQEIRMLATEGQCAAG